MSAATDLIVAEAGAAGFEVEMIDGIVPMIPVRELSTMKRTRDALNWLASARHAGGGRLYAEGLILEPPREPTAEQRRNAAGWPFTEPAVAERYGLELP